MAQPWELDAVVGGDAQSAKKPWEADAVIDSAAPPPEKPVEKQAADDEGFLEKAQGLYQLTPLGMPNRIGRFLVDNGPAMLSGMVDSGVAAYSAPYRAYTGQIPMHNYDGSTSDQAIEEAFNMANWITPASPAMAVRQSAASKTAENFAEANKAANREGNQVNLAANRIGVQLPRSVTTDSKMVQAGGKWFESQPIVGSPLIRAQEKATQQLDDAVKGVKDAYGSGSVYNAGGEVKEAATEYAKKFLVDQEKKRYDAVDELVTPNVTTPLRKTGETVLSILSGRKNATLPDGSAVKMVRDAVSSQGLNYHGIKDLRSYVGETLDNPLKLAKSGMSERDLKRVYAALSDDLRTAVVRGGGDEALSAFEKANAYSLRATKEREALQKVIGTKEPEAIVDTILAAAGTNSRASLNKLFQARKAVDKETWDELASAAIQKMGRDADGNFSPEMWITARGNLSDTGKKMLFNTTGKKELSKSLDDIDTVSRRLKELNKDFGNPSGSGRNVGYTAAASSLLKAPLRLVSGVIGGRLMARYLSQPAEAKAVADYMKAMEAAQRLPSPSTNEFFRKRATALARIAANDLGNPALSEGIATKLIFGEKAAADNNGNPDDGRSEADRENDKASDEFNSLYQQGRAF